MNTKLITIAMTLVIGIILTGSMLMPIISDAQKNAGEITTFSNETLAVSGSWEYSEVNDDITIESTSAGVTTINGETVSFTYQLPIFVSQKVLVNLAPTYILCYIVDSTDGEIKTISNTFGGTQTFELTYADGEISVSNGTLSSTTTVTWAYCADSEGTHDLIVTSSPSTKTIKVKSIDDVTLCGNYTTGDNDTFYSYHNGKAFLSEDYEFKVTGDLSTTAGATDVYDLKNYLANVGDESFNPYFALIPNSVEGHEASGAAYSLYGAIPVIVIVALLVVAIGVVARRND